MTVHPDSLYAVFQQIADRRRPQGRKYALAPLLGLVLTGALQGQASLRGAWVWAGAHWAELWQPLGFGSSHFPTLGTVWYALQGVDMDEVEQRCGAWVRGVVEPLTQNLSGDGKHLRGSKREGHPAHQLVSLLDPERRVVLWERQIAEGGSESATLLTLLREIPLAGKTITLDAGLLHVTAAQVIAAGGGYYLGPVKGNQEDLKDALDVWLTDQLSPPEHLAPAEGQRAAGRVGASRQNGGNGARAGGGARPVGGAPGRADACLSGHRGRLDGSGDANGLDSPSPQGTRGMA